MDSLGSRWRNIAEPDCVLERRKEIGVLTKHSESDISLQDGRVVSCSTGVSSSVRGSHLLSVNRLVRALRIQDEVTLATWPRIGPVILVPAKHQTHPRYSPWMVYLYSLLANFEIIARFTLDRSSRTTRQNRSIYELFEQKSNNLYDRAASTLRAGTSYFAGHFARRQSERTLSPGLVIGQRKEASSCSGLAHRSRRRRRSFASRFFHLSSEKPIFALGGAATRRQMLELFFSARVKRWRFFFSYFFNHCYNFQDPSRLPEILIHSSTPFSLRHSQ